MTELYVFCEGPTEQGFCVRLLQPYLFPNHDGYVHALKIANSRRHNVISRGGVNNYLPMRNEIVREFARHKRPRVLFTSMIDLYALPSEFPGKKENTRNPNNPRPYVEALERAFSEDLKDHRFIPYLQLHEYETLLFANPAAFEDLFPAIDKEIAKLESIANDAGDIETIDDSPQSAPSKRIIQLIPKYGKLKTTMGPAIAEKIGIPTLREKCRHFSDWLDRVRKQIAAL